MLSVIVLIICLVLFGAQVLIEKKNGTLVFLSVGYLFQIYFIMQLPLSSFLYEVCGWGISDARISVNISDSTRNKMLSLVLCAYIAFVVGKMCVRKVKIARRKAYARNGNNTTMRLVILAIILAGYLAVFSIAREFGGIRLFLSQLEYWRNVGLVGKGLYTNLVSTVLPIASLIYMNRNAQFLKEKNKKVVFIQIILLVLCSFPSLILGFRSYIFSIIIAHVVLFNLCVHRIQKKYYVVGGLVFAVYFSAYSLFRSTDSTGLQSVQYAVSNIGYSIQKILTRSRGSEIVCIQLDQMKGFRYSLDIFLDGLISWIPRSIWEGKPTALSLEYSYTFFGAYGIKSGISGTCVGEFYWEYGLIGMIVCMFLIGVFITLFHNTFTSDIKNERDMLYYSALIWPLVRIAETPSSAFFQLTIAVIVLWGITKVLFNMNLRIGTI